MQRAPLYPGLSTLIECESHALTPSMSNVPHECETSRQACKISPIKENNFFCLSLFLFFLLKPIRYTIWWTQTQKELQNIDFFFMFWFLTPSNSESWQPCYTIFNKHWYYMLLFVWIIPGHRYSTASNIWTENNSSKLYKGCHVCL